MQEFESDLLGEWGQEGGADAAASMLQRYDRVADSWSLPRVGEFWDAVALARQRDRHGEGQTIAVVDDGFDMSVPALARHVLVPNVADPLPYPHGTVVALLILAVAPKARLLLYPARTSRGWDAQAIARALQAIAQTDAQIVNLSLGQAHEVDATDAIVQLLGALPPWPDATEADFQYRIAQGLGLLSGHGAWRRLLWPPDSPLAEMVAALVDSGRAVIAAAGNARGRAYDPALRPGVFAVGFHRVVRAMEVGAERASVRGPTYTQSEFCDFGLLQPPGVLGSSFATPLISGFVALMEQRADLQAYARTIWCASQAEVLMVQPEHGDAGSVRRAQVIVDLFARAVQHAPHRHTGSDGPCPECALFAVSAFVNGGLNRLEWGYPDHAAQMLAPAEAFAPTNPHAAANYALVHAVRARRAKEAGDRQALVHGLQEAKRLMSKACALRPDHLPYERRLQEFVSALATPDGWIMAP
jgi:hypothetical protein